MIVSDYLFQWVEMNKDVFLVSRVFGQFYLGKRAVVEDVISLDRGV